MTTSSTAPPYLRDPAYEEAEKAIDRIFAEAGVDEDETLNRLQALRLHIERLMSALR